LVNTNILAVQAHPEWLPGEIERSIREIKNDAAREQTKMNFEEFRSHVLSEESHHALFMKIAKAWIRS
jgi:hypothetical protein